jgi:aryl-alcohol dehydrogenase-like predicted oxidoreductase
MTFGNDRWGSDDAEAKRIFDRYLEHGGNFIDVADVYAEGKSEEVLGRFIAEGKLHDRLAIATKFSFNPQEGNPNSGGNGRKNIYRALEGSLRRLQLDYIDLYWMHVWDTITPVEEVVSTLSDLVREGKIRYYGFSDVPAWYASRARHRPAAGVFAGGTQHRTRTHSRRPRIGHGRLSLEPAGQRLSRGQVHQRRPIEQPGQPS